MALVVAIRVSSPVRTLPDGEIDDLYEFLNVGHGGDFVLIVAWLVAALRPRGPYPILVISGEQGTAKSTASAVSLVKVASPHSSGG